jgi:4-methyl-5(b-hydroxyethyl)-thiazole monophosphate biosynthesis
MSKKVIVFFADGCEEIEALAPVDMLRRAGADVVVAGVRGKTQVSSHGISVNTDIALSELETDKEFDMIVLPGGIPGTNYLDASKEVETYINRAVEEGKYIAAICAAPSIVLGSRNLLNKKKATCYPGMEPGMKGHISTDKKVVIDGNIITASGVGVSVEFGLALVGVLYGKKVQDDLAKKVVAK